MRESGCVGHLGMNAGPVTAVRSLQSGYQAPPLAFFSFPIASLTPWNAWAMRIAGVAKPWSSVLYAAPTTSKTYIMRSSLQAGTDSSAE